MMVLQSVKNVTTGSENRLRYAKAVQKSGLHLDLHWVINQQPYWGIHFGQLQYLAFDYGFYFMLTRCPPLHLQNLRYML